MFIAGKKIGDAWVLPAGKIRDGSHAPPCVGGRFDQDRIKCLQGVEKQIAVGEGRFQTLHGLCVYGVKRRFQVLKKRGDAAEPYVFRERSRGVLHLFFQKQAVAEKSLVFFRAFRKGDVIAFFDERIDPFQIQGVVLKRLDAGWKDEHILKADVFIGSRLSGLSDQRPGVCQNFCYGLQVNVPPDRLDIVFVKCITERKVCTESDNF